MTAEFPVGSSEPMRSPSPSNGSHANSPTTPKEKGRDNSSSQEQLGYVTRARVDEVRQQLSQRDQALLADVARVKVLTGQQVRRLHFVDSQSGKRVARRDLARLVDLRVLSRLERRIGGVKAGSDGFVYALDVLGQRLVDADRRRYRTPWTPGQYFIHHAVAVSELYVRLRLLANTESQLHFDAEPAAWRNFSGPGGGRLILKPDAFLIWTTTDYEDRYFIEVDRATESLPRITDKARVYLHYWQSGREQASHGVFPRVLWIVPDEARRAGLTEALSQVDAEGWKVFAVTTEPEAAQLIADGIEPDGVAP